MTRESRWQSRLRRVICAIFVLAGARAAVVSATTFTVTDLGDSGAPGQLRTLMNMASSGDTIVIPAGTILLMGPANDDSNLSGDLDINAKDLTLHGAGSAQTIIDGSGVDRVFDIFGHNHVIICGLTIQDGNGNAAPTFMAGGGIILTGGAALTLSDVVLKNNVADDGGALFLDEISEATLANVAFTGNTAHHEGGAIFNAGMLTLDEVVVDANFADCGGCNNFLPSGAGMLNGIVFVGGGCSGTTIVTNATISNNAAHYVGGGILNYCSLSLTNVTISGNSVSQGGGMASYLTGTATLTNVTLANNTASEGGGMHTEGPASVSVKNTIVANNTQDVGGNCSGATPVSQGHNIDSGNSCAFSGSGDLSNTDPVLGPLQDNGGPTFTHALLTGSPAIDAIASGCPPPATDQRGQARPVDGDGDSVAACDIGAYEAAPVTTPACGDGQPQVGEQCDDGNTVNGDCCSSTCQFEACGSACANGMCDGAGHCVPTTTTTTSTTTSTTTTLPPTTNTPASKTPETVTVSGTFFDPLTGGLRTFDVDVGYEKVSGGGNTTVTGISNAAGTVPLNISLQGGGFSALFLDVSTTAVPVGDITVCVRYADVDDDGLVDGTTVSETLLRVLHQEGDPPTLVDRTSQIDVVQNKVCATVSSLSPFVMAMSSIVGYVPPDAVSLKSENYATKSVGKLASAIVQCYAKAAKSATVIASACADGAQLKLGDSAGKVTVACAQRNLSSVGSTVRATADAVCQQIFCPSQPPLGPKCQGLAAKSVAKLGAAIAKCNTKAALAAVGGTTRTVASTCEFDAQGKYNDANAKLLRLGCSGAAQCTMANLGVVHDQLQGAIEGTGPQIYCDPADAAAPEVFGF